MTDYIILSLFGLIVGFIGGYAGIGGAPFLIVFMTFFLGVSQHVAQGTVIAVMLGPMTLLGILAVKERVKPLLKFATVGVISYAVFSYVGASFAFMVDNYWLKIIFSAFIFLLGINESFGLLQKWQERRGGKNFAVEKYIEAEESGEEAEFAVDRLEKIQKEEHVNVEGKNLEISKNLKNHHKQNPKRMDGGNSSHKLTLFSCALIGVFIGIVGGFFGIGAGVLMTPLFITFFAMSKDDARTLSMMILMPPVSLGAVLKYSAEGAIMWTGVLIMFISYFMTNYFGSRLALSHSAKTFRKIYGYILILMSLAGIMTL